MTGMGPTAIDHVEAGLRRAPRRWLVTGAAGFIGSHLVERLLALGQHVIGLDNFATGTRRNLDEVIATVAGSAGNFELIEGDIRDPAACQRACAGVDLVLHQAALGSVPRSIADPAMTLAVNEGGLLNVLIAARDAGVSRVVYASSSAVYGDSPTMPRREGHEGRQLSPYAAGKRANVLHAAAFERAYGLSTVGLRYFNVFGSRQNPDGPYAAVIPRWVRSLLDGDQVVTFGDGETSRDFCYVANVVQANILAALTALDGREVVFNVGAGGRTTLGELFDHLRTRVARYEPAAARADTAHVAFRPGDVQHSQADIRRATRTLGYVPTHDLAQGLDAAIGWYVQRFGQVSQ
jgi:UDP-N-acetylglucosamine 4-epimerase